MLNGFLTSSRNLHSTPSSVGEHISQVKDADVVIVGRYSFSKEELNASRNLRMISVWKTGYNYIDLKKETEKGIIVSNVPDYAFDSVAEMAFVLVLNLMRKVHIADSRLREGNFDWKGYVDSQLMGKTMGVIGTGSIGERVIQITHGFNMNILSVTGHPSEEKAISEESLEECTYVCVENVEKFVAGGPQNIVNPEALAESRLP